MVLVYLFKENSGGSKMGGRAYRGEVMKWEEKLIISK